MSARINKYFELPFLQKEAESRVACTTCEAAEVESKTSLVNVVSITFPWFFGFLDEAVASIRYDITRTKYFYFKRLFSCSGVKVKVLVVVTIVCDSWPSGIPKLNARFLQARHIMRRTQDYSTLALESLGAASFVKAVTDCMCATSGCSHLTKKQKPLFAVFLLCILLQLFMYSFNFIYVNMHIYSCPCVSFLFFWS